MKIGILTHYFESTNYGGVLQAYALPKFLNNMGKEAYQINYALNRDWRKLEEGDNSQIEYSNLKDGMVIEIDNYFLNRQKKFKDFRAIVPNTNDKTYTKEKISELNDHFDIFISGSDQVWNPNIFCEPFFLDFVVDNQKKIAYAASMSVNHLTTYQESIMIPLIEAYDHISVRENTAKTLIQDKISKMVEVVTDPVLLLEKKQWQEISVAPDQQEGYVFSYFLGTFKDNRDIATHIADTLRLPIVNIPHPLMRKNQCDDEFGDRKAIDAGPKEFLGLIENSQLVITDSFHGMLFSIIFENDFFVLKRNNDNNPYSMNSRVVDLLNDLGLEDRIISTMSDVSDQLMNSKIEYSKVNKCLKRKIKYSKDFLMNAITM